MPRALEARGIVVQFGGLLAVNDVSLTLEEGSILGLSGPNGAGKSTLFNALTGYAKAKKGGGDLFAKRLTRLPPYARTRLGMARTYPTARPFEGLTVLENVLIPAFLRTSNRLEAERRAHSALEAVGLADRP